VIVISRRFLKHTVKESLDEDIGTIAYIGEVHGFLRRPKAEALKPKERPDFFNADPT
jgi:hypothetical protein